MQANVSIQEFAFFQEKNHTKQIRDGDDGE